MGGIFQNKWFAREWQGPIAHMHVNVKEFFAVTAAIRTWGKEWKNLQIVAYRDNKAEQ